MKRPFRQIKHKLIYGLQVVFLIFPFSCDYFRTTAVEKYSGSDFSPLFEETKNNKPRCTDYSAINFEIKGVAGLDATPPFFTFFSEKKGIFYSLAVKENFLIYKTYLIPELATTQKYIAIPGEIRESAKNLPTIFDETNEEMIIFFTIKPGEYEPVKLKVKTGTLYEGSTVFGEFAGFSLVARKFSFFHEADLKIYDFEKLKEEKTIHLPLSSQKKQLFADINSQKIFSFINSGSILEIRDFSSRVDLEINLFEKGEEPVRAFLDEPGGNFYFYKKNLLAKLDTKKKTLISLDYLFTGEEKKGQNFSLQIEAKKIYLRSRDAVYSISNDGVGKTRLPFEVAELVSEKDHYFFNLEVLPQFYNREEKIISYSNTKNEYVLYNFEENRQIRFFDKENSATGLVFLGEKDKKIYFFSDYYSHFLIVDTKNLFTSGRETISVEPLINGNICGKSEVFKTKENFPSFGILTLPKEKAESLFVIGDSFYSNTGIKLTKNPLGYFEREEEMGFPEARKILYSEGQLYLYGDNKGEVKKYSEIYEYLETYNLGNFDIDEILPYANGFLLQKKTPYSDSLVEPYHIQKDFSVNTLRPLFDSFVTETLSIGIGSVFPVKIAENIIALIDPDKQVLTSFGGLYLTNVRKIRSDNIGNIYVLDGEKQITLFSAEGKFIAAIPTSDIPVDFIINGSGDIAVQTETGLDIIYLKNGGKKKVLLDCDLKLNILKDSGDSSTIAVNSLTVKIRDFDKFKGSKTEFSLLINNNSYTSENKNGDFLFPYDLFFTSGQILVFQLTEKEGDSLLGSCSYPVLK